jgi:hypothetical protein
VEGKKKKKFKKNGNSPKGAGVYPWSQVAGWPLVDTCACQAVPNFF